VIEPAPDSPPPDHPAAQHHADMTVRAVEGQAMLDAEGIGRSSYVVRPHLQGTMLEIRLHRERELEDRRALPARIKACFDAAGWRVGNFPETILPDLAGGYWVRLRPRTRHS
jgi:hypothetical protein